MSLSNTMLQFDNWGEEFRYSGDKITYAWSGQKQYFTDRNLQDFVWMKVLNGTRKAITADYKKNDREYNNRQIFGVDDASTFYDTVLEANGMVTILDNTPALSSGLTSPRNNEKLKIGVNPNSVVETYQVPNEYFDPLAAPGTPYYNFAKFGLYSALEVQFSTVGDGRLLRIATPAFFGPNQSWDTKADRSNKYVHPGVMPIDNFEFVVTDSLIWEIVSESVFLLAPECCA